MKKEINTPNYPRNYTASKTCYWYVITSPGSRIQTKVITFQVERINGLSCSRTDSLTIYDGGSSNPNHWVSRRRYCGFTNPSIPISSSNRLYLEWRSLMTGYTSISFKWRFKISFHSKRKSQLYGNRNSSLHYGETLFDEFDWTKFFC